MSVERPESWYEMLTAARSEVASLTAENERLRKERDEARATKDMHKERQQEAELALSSLRELESAARKWRACHGVPDVPSKQLHGAIRALIAAVDALPPTPPATEDSDDTA